MSETANTIIKAALRAIGAIATGETPTHDELNDGLEAMKFMLRSWSARNIVLYYTEDETLTMTGASPYTIGSGGTINTVRPASIRGAWTTDGPVKLIDEDQYRQIRMDTTVSGGPFEYLWYNPAYPLGLLYPWPLGNGTMYLDCLKPLTDPTSITGTVSFPPEYDDAMKWNLAVRLCPEYGKEPPQVVAALAGVTLAGIETRNFALQINSIRTELLRLAGGRYNIERG